MMQFTLKSFLLAVTMFCLIVSIFEGIREIGRLKQEVLHLKVERDYFEREYKRLWFTRHPQ